MTIDKSYVQENEVDCDQLHQTEISSAMAAKGFQLKESDGKSFWDAPPTWQFDIPSLIDTTDLNALIEYFAGAGQMAGSSIRYHCPHPDHVDEHPSFSVSTLSDGRERARCWSQCDWHGDALDFVEWHMGLETKDALEWLKTWNTSADLNVLSTEAVGTRQLHSLEIVDCSSLKLGIVADHTMSTYLKRRQWPDSVVGDFSLTVVEEPNGDLRIRHPFLTPDSDGNWTASYWQDRSVGDIDPKWKSPKNGRPTLFNLPSLETENVHTVIICEGPADTITASVSLSKEPGVAVIGVPGVQAWRPEYAELIQGLKVVVLADNDDAGQILETAIARSVRQSVVIARPVDGDITDTATNLGKTAVRELLLTAINQEPQLQPETTRSQHQKDFK